MQLKITLIMEGSPFTNSEGVSINIISESSLLTTRSVSDGSVVPVIQVGSVIYWIR